MLCNNMLEAMGNTPIVRINRVIANNNASVYVKLEGFNPGGSHKSRIALNMILEAEKNGVLVRNSGQTIIEPTGGNTGTGLAMAGAILGYRVCLVIPKGYSIEKQRVLRAYGAEVILAEDEQHLEHVWSILVANPQYVLLNQFNNYANPDVHRKTTAAEILRDMERVDYFVCGIGTGGCITGIGEVLKATFPRLKVIGVQPEGCDILNNEFVPHEIQGLAVGILPPILNKALIDDMMSVSSLDAKNMMRRLALEEGMLVGLSSGANIWAACQLAAQLRTDAVILTIAPDFGNSYLDCFE